MNNFILKALQLAAIADQEYEAVKASPNPASLTVLQPGNFNGLLAELATVFGKTAA